MTACCGTLLCPNWSVTCADFLPQDLRLDVPANGLDRHGAAFEQTSQRRGPIELSAPEDPVFTSVSLALNVKALVSIVVDRESNKHARAPHCSILHKLGQGSLDAKLRAA
jgi:hypothetical protein